MVVIAQISPRTVLKFELWGNVLSCTVIRLQKHLNELVVTQYGRDTLHLYFGDI